MTKRFIFTWKDETEEARFKAMAEFEGVSMSEMMHRVIAQIPVIGSIPSSGTEMYDKLDEIHARIERHREDRKLRMDIEHEIELVREARKEIAKASGVTLVHDINDIEIVGSDNGRE